MKFALVVPWHDHDQFNSFLKAWGLRDLPEWFFGQQDQHKEGCAKTKNKGIERALEAGAEVVIVLDDDCYPYTGESYTEDVVDPLFHFHTLDKFTKAHLRALLPQPVELFIAVTDPPSRGTPYFNRSITLPVAATMGFWTGVPDLDAASQLRHDIRSPIEFKRQTMFQRFFAFSGMNCAFRAEFWPHFRFDETAERFDDIWMGYRLQEEAYRRGYCINLNSPLVRHVRQSNVWHNLRVEAENMERNETEWQKYVPTLTKPS